ncbi:MAG TPA: hypothetical protein VNZ86_20735 [Bacteroidia bacterium]|jgi:hypothetical protein|nr:hypothetical protein [Bacteroidia bacterium]
MENPFLPESGSEAEKQALLQAVMDQLIKDFGRFGLEIVQPPPGKDPYTALLSQIAPCIENALRNNDVLLTGILYSIDLNEGQVRKALASQPDRAYHLVLTDLILKRELQKVVLRRKYSS